MLLNSLSVFGGAVYLGVFSIENDAVYSLSLSLQSGVGQGTEGVTLVFV